MGAEPGRDMEAEGFYITDYQRLDYVRRALTSASLGDPDQYNHLVGMLHHKKYLSPEDVGLLVSSLDLLSGAVSYIDDTYHGQLISTIGGMKMWDYETNVMDALVQLIVSLAATNGKHLDLCLEMLVNHFRPPAFYIENSKTAHGAAKKEQVLERVHSALKEITNLVPLMPARLCSIIRSNMPDFVFVPEPIAVTFAENIFKLETSSLGQLVGSSTLIMLVIDRLIDLDLELGWEVILSDDPSKFMFEMELEDEDLEEDENDGVEFIRKYKLTGVAVADKLDSLMVLTFDYVKSSYDNGRLVEVFESLLQSFQKTILNAYKSKFAQFVMFYACSLDPEICGARFAQYLADVFTSGNFPLLTRMSAIAYLASYMARAKFLTASFITSMLERLSHWCFEYCQHNEDFQPIKHRVFYAGCQAIIYVLCFRMRSIMEIPRLNSQLRLIPLRKILKNSLDPLKVCLPLIVREFVRQANVTHLLEKEGSFAFNDVLESELSKAYGGSERLDMFFPFDPCLLQKSDSYIAPSFISWSKVKPTYNDDDDDTDENFSDDEPDRKSRNVGMVDNFEEDDDEFDEELDGFNASLTKMSITPRDTAFMKFAKMPSRIRPSTSPESL